MSTEKKIDQPKKIRTAKVKVPKIKTLRPLCKWSGGKRDEIKLFKKHYPTDIKRFIEPFIGGGAVYFDLNFEGENVINDVHPELINFYKMINEGHAKEIYELIKTWGTGELDYYIVRGGSVAKLKNGEIPFVPKNNIDLAARFYYLRKTCFRGMIRYSKNGNFNIPWGKYKTVNFDEILRPEYTNLLSRTEITLGDYKKIFEKYNSPENFVFLDPPYDSEFNDYGFDNFNRQSQIELAEIFKTTKNKCMMVISETDFIRNLYKDYIVEKYPKKYAFKIYDNRIGDEIDKNHLVIKNYTNE
jgi:DNA adenine methylase